MSDKEFWTEAYLEAYKVMLREKGAELFGDDDNEYAMQCIDSECACCAEIADNALEYFKLNMQNMASTAKKEIETKENTQRKFK